MKLQSFYLASLLIFVSAVTNGLAQEQETLSTPTTTENDNPSETPEEAQDVPELAHRHPKQLPQQQQVPGAVHQHHSFVRQPSPIPADERHVDADADAVPPEQQKHSSQYPDTDTNSQHDQGDNVEIPESNVNVDEPLHHDEPEQENRNSNQEQEELDATHAYGTPTPTIETFVMKETVHRYRDNVGRDGSEASEHDDAFYQQKQHQQQKQQHQQQKQDPATELNVEQLKLLLQQRHALDSDVIPEDDRTLLDIFGEVTKEYLTQNVVRYVVG
jgi:hypothetical protein